MVTWESTCALCGLKIAWDGDWITEYRAVYAKGKNWQSSIRLSGIGKMSDDPFSLAAPVDPSHRWNQPHSDPWFDIELNPISLERLYHSRNPSDEFAWGFGFHPPCWDLLNKLIEPNLSDLFLACLSMRMDRRTIIDWGHKYGGVVTQSTRSQKGLPAMKHRRGLHYSGEDTNPFHTPCIEQLFQNETSPEGIQDEESRFQKRYQTNGDKFQRLPPEILQEILVALPSADVVNLRKSSPVFASLELWGTFWASRFQRGHEFGFIFEAMQSKPASWRSLYQSIRSLREEPGVVNRRRIWELALNVKCILAQMSNVQCQGQAISSIYEPDMKLDNGLWHYAGRGVKELDERGQYAFDRGCKVLRTRVLQFESGSRFHEIWASFVRISGISFVSGLRFVLNDGSMASIGYIHSKQETLITFPGDQASTDYRVSGWHLAFHWMGVKAIAVITQDGRSSSWAGDPSDTPRWCLSGHGQIISSIKAEFDGLKMVSISRDEDTDIYDFDDLMWRNSCLWSPDVPPKGAFFCGTEKCFWLEEYYSTPVSYDVAMFGGSNGEKLSQLVEIVVHIANFQRVQGIEFIYTDPSDNMAFGAILPVWGPQKDPYIPPEYEKYSMPIGGPDGEMIQQIHVLESDPYIAGLKVHTNRDRVAYFPPELQFKGGNWSSIEPRGATVIGLFVKYSFYFQGMNTISIGEKNLKGQ